MAREDPAGALCHRPGCGHGVGDHILMPEGHCSGASVIAGQAVVGACGCQAFVFPQAAPA